MMKVMAMFTQSPFTAYYAARVCTATEDKIGEFEQAQIDAVPFLQKLIKQGHESVLEHLNFTFHVTGISRALLQELARHRHISLSVKSTRWALKRDYEERQKSIDDVLDAAWNNLPECNEDEYTKLEGAQGLAIATYNLLYAVEDAIKAGLPNDFIKYYLPECFTTDLVLTVNARELRHIFKLRAAPNALLEFNELCLKLREAIPVNTRVLFDDCADWNATVNRVYQD